MTEASGYPSEYLPGHPPSRRTGQSPAAEVDQARMLAWEVLRAVDERGAYANLLLPALFAERLLSARDRAFATELAYGALRAQGLLDDVLDTVASRPMTRVDPPLRDALRLAAYQMIYTRVPSRAAVATTVDLVRVTTAGVTTGSKTGSKTGVTGATTAGAKAASRTGAKSAGTKADTTPGAGGRGEGPARFANAVLRRVAARVAETGGDLAALLDAPPFARDPLGHLAAVTAHPRWVVDTFADALRGDMHQTRLALEADDARPAVHLVAYPGRIGADELADQARGMGLTAAPGPYSPYAVRLDGGDPGRLPAVRAGLAGVQDEGSQLVALAAARAPRTGADLGLVVDLCAGPGGKAALLAALLRGPSTRSGTHDSLSSSARFGMPGSSGSSGPVGVSGISDQSGKNDSPSSSGSSGRFGAYDSFDSPGASASSGPFGSSGLSDTVGPSDLRRPSDLLPAGRLLAIEPHPTRARMVARVLTGAPGVPDALGATGVRRAVVVQADGREPPLPPASADLVLVDAPCTGLGALRRRPEARWRKSPADVAALTGLQRRLLAAALDLARPGGVVAYATCSPHPAETEAVVSEVVAAMPGRVSVLDARECLPEVGDLGDGPFVQLWPHRHGTDAMFLALLRRTAP